MNDKLNPYIERGSDAGRIQDPLIAHEIANTINHQVDRSFPADSDWIHKLWWRATRKRDKFADKEGTGSADIQAVKTVNLERTDSLTGLQNKTAFIKDRRALYTNLSDGEEIIVARLDMGMLNYFNQARGKDIGDQYLKKAATLIDGKSFQNVQDIYHTCDFAKGYREGGDEFVIMLKTKKNLVHQIKISLNSALSENIRLLELPGGDIALGESEKAYEVDRDILLDFGISYATEGRNILKKIMDKTNIERAKNEGELTGIIVDRIAEMRLDIHKARKRIGILKKLLSEDDDLFNQVYSYAAKGAFAIDKDMLKKINSDTDINKWIAEIYSKRLINEAYRMSDLFQRALSSELVTSMDSFALEK